MRLKPLYYKHLDPSLPLDYRNLRGARNLALISDATKTSTTQLDLKRFLSTSSSLCLM